MKRPVGQLEEWEWIDRYWSGQMSPEEKAFFENEMKNDAALAREAESLREGIQEYQEAHFEQNIKKTLAAHQQRNRRNRKVTGILTLWGGFASAACIAFAVFLSYAPLKTPDQENDLTILRELRSKYRSDSTNNMSMFKKQAFDLFFEGQSYLAEGQSKLAQDRFEKVLTYPNLRPYFREAAQWHLVICYLRTNQIDKARTTYETFNKAREYKAPDMERWKVWWSLRRAELTGEY